MIDDHPGQSPEQLGMARPDRADPLERPAVDDHEEVVLDAWLRIRPLGRDARQEVVEGRDRIGADRRGPAAVELDDPGDPERRPERIGVGILVADDERLARLRDPLGHRVRDGPEVRLERDRHRAGLRLPAAR